MLREESMRPESACGECFLVTLPETLSPGELRAMTVPLPFQQLEIRNSQSALASPTILKASGIHRRNLGIRQSV